MKPINSASKSGRHLLPLGSVALMASALGFFLTSSPQASTHATGLRLIFLNGVDISAARGQQLKKVDIQIAENGDIYISAPHYQVHEEDSYVPLSQYVQGLSHPSHTKPSQIPEKSGGDPQPFQPSQPLAKPGEPLSPPAASQTFKDKDSGQEESNDEESPFPSEDAAAPGDNPPPGAPVASPKPNNKSPLIPKGQPLSSPPTQTTSPQGSGPSAAPVNAAEPGGPPAAPTSAKPPQTVQNTNQPSQ